MNTFNLILIKVRARRVWNRPFLCREILLCGISWDVILLLRLMLPGCFFDCFVVTCEGGKGGELGGPLKHGHLRMLLRDMMRKVDDVVV